MDTHIDAAAAAADLETLMDTVARENTHVFITRTSGPSVVVISYEEWLRNQPAPDWLERSWAKAEELGLDKMTMDEIDEEIAAYRREKREAEAKHL